jgi:1-phosphofructokinase family hexose kinase
MEAMSDGYTLCLGLTPAVQRTLRFETMERGRVNRARKTSVSAAGKGLNIAVLMTRLGAPARLVAFRGGAGGTLLTEHLARCGVPVTWVDTPASPTRTCVTALESDGTVTELVEEAVPPAPEDWGRLWTVFDHALARAAAVAISGALMPGANPQTYARILRAASARGMPSLIDSQGEPLRLSLAARPTLVKLNGHELEITTGRTCPGVAGLCAAAEELRSAGAGTVLVTRGAEPALWLGDTGAWMAHPPAVKAVNPIGAGDAVSAGILDGWRRRLNPMDAAIRGLACGSAKASVLLPEETDPAVVDRLASQMRWERL